MHDQRADLQWRDDAIPVSTRFDDPYFSLDNGLAETAHVFLQGNDLPTRFRPGFHIAELGFGTGLNLLAALKLWRETGQQGVLRFTSFEAFPMTPAEMTRAQSAFPEIAEVAGDMASHWTDDLKRVELPDLEFELIRGDARMTLVQWQGQADAWFLDGFSPAKNPELWGPELMAEVFRHTKADGTAATYTAAGFVRRGLQDAGFTVERSPGFGRKRHMTTARKAEA
ncbi:tRNA (5-methylaminomethyl-2-thiouridine)(34)-methyltransferase MnmD [Thalassovita sp.]|uniref:tRNA (5-methylaminomethyl-2-thiouridine)(34)-methyltransferase MnmD n=1 Tax=Thalassovita sp. TaxID=1979401 RepID=UPI002B27141C|nr:tRNA (5-methylaminomethyl-2-thiouridine)(34)-methyltransferase MnmD [Thalassovita sp.]